MVGLAPGARKEQAIAALAGLFRTDASRIELMFGHLPATLRSESSIEKAEQVRARIERCGVVLRVEGDEAQADAVPAPSPQMLAAPAVLPPEREPTKASEAAAQPQAMTPPAQAQSSSARLCPKCGYQRRESDRLVPDYECPKCGVVYAKYEKHLASLLGSEQAAPAEPMTTSAVASPSTAAPDPTAGVGAGEPVVANTDAAALVDSEAVERCLKAFESLLQQSRERTGVARSSALVNGAAGVLAVGLPIVVWIMWTWYWALLALLVGVVVAVLVSASHDKNTAPAVVAAFESALPAALRQDAESFEVALRIWLSLQLGELKTALEQRLLPKEPASPETEARIQAYWASEAGQTRREEQMLAEIVEGKEVHAVEADDPDDVIAQGERRDAAFCAKFPEASAPVTPMDVHWHPSMPGEVGVAPELAISSQFLYFIDKSVGRVPLDCVKSMKLSEASAGVSVDAIVRKAFSAFVHNEDVRVRIDFHIWFPVRNRGSWMSHSGLSFVIPQWAWKEQSERWMEACNRYYPSAPECPRCKSRSIVGDTVGLAAQMGFGGQPPIRAHCESCKSKYLLHLGEGRWLEDSKG